MKEISFKLPENEHEARSLNDQALAFAWAAGQNNPAPISDEDAGRIAECIGREIIRRWLLGVEPALWNHQGRHHYWSILQKHGQWFRTDDEDKAPRQWHPFPAPILNEDHPCRVGMHHFIHGVCRECGDWQESKQFKAERGEA